MLLITSRNHPWSVSKELLSCVFVLDGTSAVIHSAPSALGSCFGCFMWEGTFPASALGLSYKSEIGVEFLERSVETAGTLQELYGQDKGERDQTERDQV